MKNTLKLYLLSAIALLLSSSCIIGPLTNQVSESMGIDNATLLTKKSYPIESVKKVKVTTSGGYVSVVGDADQEAVLEMYVRPNSSTNLSKDEMQKILDRDYEISIQQKGNTLEAFAKRKDNLTWENAISISFKIRTSKNVATELNTSGGSIKLANLSGRQDFRTSGGILELDNLEGDITGKTSGGSIQTSNSKGIINLTTSGGGIRIDNLNGNVFVSTSGGSIKGENIAGTLVAETSGGSIDLADLACKLDASTSGGSVTTVFRELTNSVQLSTSAGSVNITLPEDSSADLNLKGFKVNTETIPGFDGDNVKGKLVGKMNGGGIVVHASTSAGSVNLKFN